MGKFVGAVIGVLEIAVGVVVPGMQWLIPIGIGTTISGLTGALLAPGSPKQGPRTATGTQVQVGEVERQGVFGEGAIGGSLVDAFNYGGTYGTDWTVLVIALADHKCQSLEGFYVNNDYVAFAGDGTVSGYNGQLAVYFRDGSWTQSPPAILTSNAPYYPAGHPLAGTRTWTSNDRGRGVAYVVVAYKADDPQATNPVWTAGRPTFVWRLKGLLVYSAREDDTVGGSGAHRWTDDSTRAWSDNLIDCRYTWVRGIYAEGHVDDPKYLLLGRGLTADETPPENQFAPANLCDELVPLAGGGNEKRYRVGGPFGGGDAYIDTENDFAAACGGIVVDRAGSVELVPGAAETPVWSITDADLVEQSTVTARDFRSKTDSAWVNMVSAVYTEPTQKWSPHAAPLRRDVADVAADGEPRIGQPQLKLVTSGTQAQRVAEMVRKKGRLWKTRSAVLPPRLAGVEHGDWLVWTSNRYGPFGSPGTAVTYRVVSDGQGQDWRNSVTLEEISADVFAWTSADELGDDGQAVDNPAISSFGAYVGGLPPGYISSMIQASYATDADPLDGLVQATESSGTVTIHVEDHTRTYPDLSAAISVLGTDLTIEDDGTTAITTLTQYHLYYDDYDRDGLESDDVTPVIIKATQDPQIAANSPSHPARHYLATITTPDVGGSSQAGGAVPGGWDSTDWCVADDTPIQMANVPRDGPGQVKLARDVRAGEWVWSFNPATCLWGAFRVARSRFSRQPVMTAGGHPRSTGRHRFADLPAETEGSWRFAGWRRMREIGRPDGEARVWLPSIEEAHTYLGQAPTGEWVLNHNIKA